jgi:hypothetical protein
MLVIILIALTAALLLLSLAAPAVIVGAAALLVAAAACIILAGAVLLASITLPLLSKGLELLGAAIESALNNIGIGIKEFLVSIGEALVAVGDSIAEIITSIAEALGVAVSTLGEGIAGAITDIISSVGKGIAEGITAISDSIGTFGNNLTNASLGIEALGNSVRSLKGVGWAEAAVGIAEFATALKKIKKNSEAVTLVTDLLDVIHQATINAGSEGEQFANNYTDGIIKAINSARSIIAQTLEEDFHPRITPVLDFSNVNGYNAGSMGSINVNATNDSASNVAFAQALAKNKPIDYTSKLNSIISLNQSLIQVVRSGGNVYLDGKIIAGYVNAHLGGLST